MAFLPTLERLLSYAGPVAAAVLLFRLSHEGLLGRYRFFAVFVGCLVAEGVVLFTIRQHTMTYLRTFITVDTVLSVIQILVVIELFSLVLRGYRGITRSGHLFLIVALAASVGVSFAVGAIQDSAATPQYPALQHYLLIARGVAFALLAFLGLTLGFLFWFPIPLSRNVVIYSIGFSIYFASRALTRLAGPLISPQNLIVLSTISLAILAGCLIFWTISLTRGGESVSVTVGHRWQPEEAQALVRQLESINKTLLRTAPE